MPTTEGEINKAIKLMKLRTTSRFLEDMYFQLAVERRYRQISEENRAAAMQRAQGNMELLDGPVRRSRRLDLEAESLTRPERYAGEEAPLVIKVLMAGSGYNGWKTQVESTEGVFLEWERADDPEDKNEITHHTRQTTKGPELMTAGPGASSAKGNSVFGGSSDTGSNAIAALAAQVPVLVIQAIEAGLENDRRRSIVVLIKAHSRGSVAASQAAEEIQGKYPQARVEVTLIDPVPGPQHEGADVAIDIGGKDGAGGLAESTLVYSIASGYGVGFTPQKVRGAKRIIVSRQDHSVGLQNGFVYQGELYKGSSLNSLAEGVYVDQNKNGENSVELKWVASIDEAKKEFDQAYENSSAWVGDGKTRREIIDKAVAEVFDRFSERA